jgi:hypothetical protein
MLLRYRGGIVGGDQNVGCESCCVEVHAGRSSCTVGAGPCLPQRLQALLQQGAGNVLGQTRLH